MLSFSSAKVLRCVPSSMCRCVVFHSLTDLRFNLIHFSCCNHFTIKSISHNSCNYGLFSIHCTRSIQLVKFWFFFQPYCCCKKKNSVGEVMPISYYFRALVIFVWGLLDQISFNHYKLLHILSSSLPLGSGTTFVKIILCVLRRNCRTFESFTRLLFHMNFGGQIFWWTYEMKRNWWPNWWNVHDCMLTYWGFLHAE